MLDSLEGAELRGFGSGSGSLEGAQLAQGRDTVAMEVMDQVAEAALGTGRSRIVLRGRVMMRCNGRHGSPSPQ